MTSRCLSILIIATIICICIVNSTLAQISPDRSAFDRQNQMFGPPLFLYDTYYFLTRDSLDNTLNYRLHVYVAFANDILQFVKERQGHFTASYDLFVSIFDHKGNHIAEKLAGNDINVPTFEATNSREMLNKHQLQFDLIPAQYKLVLNLTDHDTQKSLHREKKIDINSFAQDKISVSAIIFADKLITNSLKNIQEISPNLNRNFVDPKSDFWAYFEIYPASTSSILKFNYTVTDAADQAIIRNEREIKASNKIMPYVLNLGNDIKTPGRYTLIIQLEEKTEKAITEAKFSANWSNFEFSKLNINTAIETLKEFVPEKDIKNILQTPDSTKEAWFELFWKERDPTPDTDKNELQEEFYHRVDFANNNFTVNALDKEGWKTDRGNIYVKYGPPTDVERHQDQLNLPPYEIWYYEKLDRRYYFEDKSGVGDFQLVRIE